MVFETKDQIIRRKKLARFKFRTLVRKVFFNASWISELDEEKIGENVQKNVAIILKRSHKQGALTMIEKRILQKKWKDRNEEENKVLELLFNSLPCFASFTPVSYATSWHYLLIFYILLQVVRKKLIKAIEFHFFPKDKVLYLQNHLSHSMIFMILGEVVISKLKHDRESGELGAI